MGWLEQSGRPIVVLGHTRSVIVAERVLKLVDLANAKTKVVTGDDEAILVRGLTLKEMIDLFMENAETFLQLYAVGLENITPETLTPFLLSAPTMVARVIAFACDEPESAETVEKYMPATVQLIALEAAWKRSVPDPKKASELLSQVTALLQQMLEKGKQIKDQQLKSSPTTTAK